MMIMLKYTLICTFLLRVHANMLLPGPAGERQLYLYDILEQIQDEWLKRYVVESFTVCPEHTLMCSKTVLKGNISIQSTYLADTSSCCVECDCSESCEETHTCCLHINSSDTSKARKYVKHLSCMDTYRYQNTSSGGHLIVSSCPESTGTEEKFLCEDTNDEESRPLLDTVPVTFVSGGVHFANKFCAACHGINDDNLLLWDVKISCLLQDEDELTLENLRSLMKERDDCFLQYTPPQSSAMATKYSKCMPNVIRSCNKSGTWQLYNEEAEDLCTDPFFEEIHTMDDDFSVLARYKNVFCAICNGITDFGPMDCIGIQLPPVGIADFTMLLSLSAVVSRDVYTTTVCPLGYTFISLMNKCMKTRCSSPMVTDIFHNNCIPPDKVLPNNRIDIAFTITIAESLSLNDRADFEREVFESVSILFYVYDCTISFVYELETSYQGNMTDILHEKTNVVYVYVPAIVEDAHHRKAMEILEMKTLPQSKNVSLNGLDLAITFSRYDNDPAFIASFIDAEQGFLRIQNPYNRAMVVKFPDRCPDSFESERIYPVNFMDCASVLVSIKAHDWQRNENGLKIGKSVRHIKFSEFKSLNCTHVYVCQSALAEIAGSSSAENMKYGISIFHFTCLYFAVNLN